MPSKADDDANLWKGFRLDERRPFFERLREFLASDHRYVFLGTSLVAAFGILLSTMARPAMSFFRHAYPLELATYMLLVAWLVVSAIALASKLRRGTSYGELSPFATKRGRLISRLCSYAVWACTLAFLVDRVALGIASRIDEGIHATQNPSDDLASAAYMVSNSLEIYQKGIVNTIIIAVVGTVFAFLIASLLVLMRVQSVDRQDHDFVRFWKVLGRLFATAYSTVIRSTPMMVQTFVIYYSVFGLLRGFGMSVTRVGEVWSAFTAGIVIMSLNSSPYMLEVLRAGIEAVDGGQAEAARSLGMSQWQTLVHVIFPQGLKNAIPALSNEFIINIKDSSILSVIGVLDLMFATTTVSGMYFKTTPVYLVAAGVYFLLAIVANRILALVSSRLEVGGTTASGLGVSHGEH